MIIMKFDYYINLVKGLIKPVVGHYALVSNVEYIEHRSESIAWNIMDIQDGVYNDYLAFI